MWGFSEVIDTFHNVMYLSTFVNTNTACNDTVITDNNKKKNNYRVVFISSFHELMQSRGVRRPSVCLSVRLSVCKLLHASRYFYHKHDSIATKLAHNSPHMGVLKVKVKRKGHMIRTLL